MDVNIDVRKSYCLSKTISNLLGIDENIYFASKSILSLHVDELGYLYTNIDKNIVNNCKKMNLKIYRKLINTKEISSLLDNNLIIGHIKTRNLKYNKIYAIGENTMHYVEVTSVNDNKSINIVDYFIPTLTPSTYKGKIALDSDMLNVYLIDKPTNINYSNLYLNLKNNIIYSVLNHKKIYINTQKYINGIEKNLTQYNAMSYNINFVTSGYLSTRIMFYINLSKVFEINKQLKDKLEEILNNIIKLEFKTRILFTKLHFRFSNNLKIELIITFKEIFKNELMLIKIMEEVINYELI